MEALQQQVLGQGESQLFSTEAYHFCVTRSAAGPFVCLSINNQLYIEGMYMS